MNGTIKKYIEDKGFGFIKTDSEEVFFHVSNFVGDVTPAEGMSVSFELGKNDKGSFATDVRVVEG